MKPGRGSILAVFCPTRTDSRKAHNRCNLYVEEITKPRLSFFAFILLFCAGVFSAGTTLSAAPVPIPDGALEAIAAGLPYALVTDYWEFELPDGEVAHGETRAYFNMDTMVLGDTHFWTTPAPDPLTQATPEPATIVTLAVGLLLLGAAKLR